MEPDNNLKPAKRLIPEISIKLLVVATLFLLALIAFGYIAHEAVIENEDLFDRKVFDLFSGYSTTRMIRFMKFFTFFGSSTFLFPAYVVIITYLLFAGRRKFAINIAVIAISSTALMFGLKQLFHRHRPDLPLIESLKTFSFPSGHALSSFIFCSALVYLVWNGRLRPAWKWVISCVLILFSITIGISRIMLKVHYPTDVIASFCLGFVWVISSFYVLNKVNSPGK